jgi:hypothetical protein
MLARLILAKWAEASGLPKAVEGDYTSEQLAEANSAGYNIYFLPNYPKVYNPNTTVDGTHIDTFEWVFVDFDLKSGAYSDKETFVDTVLSQTNMPPTRIVDSGNGIHVYYRIVDLDAKSYLRFQRRLCRLFTTDEAVSKIYQLMRLPGTTNVKNQDSPRLCQTVYEEDNSYTAEQLDRLLPPISIEDEAYCQRHYEKTYNLDVRNVKVDDTLPPKFGELIASSQEAKDIWSGRVDDRSKGDWRLGHLMFAHGFTRDEAMSVLVNSAKAVERAPTHRVGYAEGIVDKIWTFETKPNSELDLSSTVKDILAKRGDTIKGTRIPCYRWIDATEHGFRLGQVIGLVAGSGVGKTAVALNLFLGFVQNNPDLEHFFVPLEQPANEIAERWRNLCGDRTYLHDKVHVLSNYSEDGSFRHLSLDQIKDYILKFQKVTGKKVGCVVIDHIGALNKKTNNGENQGLMDICHSMKAFAIQTNTLMVMQSQAPREKAGIGDLELNKDSAYGTVFFESYVDYLITIWQPLKRAYAEEGCPTVTSFKFCKIRHKKQHVDQIKEDVCYRMFFDPETGHLRQMTQDEEKSFDFFNSKCVNLRKRDRKTDLVTYTSVTWDKETK